MLMEILPTLRRLSDPPNAQPPPGRPSQAPRPPQRPQRLPVDAGASPQVELSEPCERRERRQRGGAAQAGAVLQPQAGQGAGQGGQRLQGGRGQVSAARQVELL